MKAHFKINALLIRLALIFISMMSCMPSVVAQASSSKYKSYLGFAGSFGRRSFKSESNYLQINRSVVSVDGGQVGLTFGSRVVRGDIGLIGYYSSVTDIAGTIDLYTNHATVKLYPAGLLTKKNYRLEPYINVGIAYDRYKFYGHYAQNGERMGNYSGQEPFLGVIKQTSSTVGIGLEFKILDQYDFVHLFTDLKWSRPLTNVSSSEFDHTRLSGNTIFNIGLAFGYHR
jgi:hypothetical protein